MTHDNVVRLFTQTKLWFEFNASDVWTLFHSYAFDFSVWELWGALFHGGKLVIVPYWLSRSPEEFLRLLRVEKVTVTGLSNDQAPQIRAALTRAARGMTTLESQTHVGELYGIEISPDLVSAVTDSVLEDVGAWQRDE